MSWRNLTVPLNTLDHAFLATLFLKPPELPPLCFLEITHTRQQSHLILRVAVRTGQPSPQSGQTFFVTVYISDLDAVAGSLPDVRRVRPGFGTNILLSESVL